MNKINNKINQMPSFFKRAKGVQKPHIVAHKSHGFFNLNLNCNLNYLAPVVPFSSVFESSDCIWYYGTLYVKEAVAVSKMACAANAANNNNEANTSAVANTIVVVNTIDAVNTNEDDDAESVCSSTSTSVHSGNPNKSTRSIAKTNQFRYIHDGTRLRHLVNGNEWHATFDAETNRVIRTPDGVAFDTLRQFARVHCNEVLGTTSVLNNVWSDPQFQYQGDDGEWHPLSVLRTT